MFRQALAHGNRYAFAAAGTQAASRAGPRVGLGSGFGSNMIPRMTQAFARPGSMISVRFLSEDVRSAIESAVSSAPVVLFMKGTPEAPACGFSRATIQILGYQGVDPDKFAAYNVLEDPELRSGIKEYSNWPTIPQLYVNKEFVGGHDIIVSMSQSGELADLLEKEDVLVPEEEEEGQAKA